MLSTTFSTTPVSKKVILAPPNRSSPVPYSRKGKSPIVFAAFREVESDEAFISDEAIIKEFCANAEKLISTNNEAKPRKQPKHFIIYSSTVDNSPILPFLSI